MLKSEFNFDSGSFMFEKPDSCYKEMPCPLAQKIETLSQDIKDLSVPISKNPSVRKTYQPLRNDGRLNAIFKTQLRLSKQRNSEVIEAREKLPVCGKKKEILQIIENNSVVVIKGETGCGKTTQIPQYILDDYIENDKGSLCKVICTQPRKISAIGVAKRVAQERGEPCGKNQSTGYQVRLDRNVPRHTGSILYCTTGVMINLLHKDPLLSSYSHVILDEVHERNLEMDFLIILLRDLSKQRVDLRLILMSATMKAETFSEYFNNCPTMEIPGFTYPVEKYMLEDVVELTKFTCSEQNRHTTDMLSRVRKPEEKAVVLAFLNELRNNYSDRTLNTVRKWNENNINFELVITLLKHICAKEGEGAILVFLPGWDNINDLYDRLSRDPIFKAPGCVIIMLHSMIPIEEQQEVFNPAPEGVRKIVLSTNIAETSITVEDVVFVIDCGKMKLSSYDGKMNTSRLESCWVSRANAQQRRGRAGRVKAGKCYHLFTSYRHSRMEDYHLPEMLRTSLANICLIIKYLKLGDITELLLKAIDHPPKHNICASISHLQSLNALDKYENITTLGLVLAEFPIDPSLSKMLLFAAIFSCLNPILTVVSVLDCQDPFCEPTKKRHPEDFLEIKKEFEQTKIKLADGRHSDHLMFARVFELWEMSVSKKNFCKKNFLSMSRLKMIKSVRAQLVNVLYNLGFVRKANPREPSSNKKSKNELLLRGIICAGLYPNIAIINKSVIRTRGSKVSCFTDNDLAFVHSKSIQSIKPDFSDKLLVYFVKLGIPETYLFDTTVVSPSLMYMFTGKLPGGFTLEEAKKCLCCIDWKTAETASTLMTELTDKVIGIRMRKKRENVDSLIHRFIEIVQLNRSLSRNRIIHSHV